MTNSTTKRPTTPGVDDDDSISAHSDRSTPNPSLRDSLMRERRNRDPLLYFEVVRELGFGSMGSVSLVKKRANAIGGSSRKSFVGRLGKAQGGGCFSLPVIGPILKACSGKNSVSLKVKDLFHSECTTKKKKEEIPVLRRSLTSIMNDDEQCDMTFALKSIHLDCIDDPSYVEELKNEIDLLKQLDHPNIVRAIETFDCSNQLFMLLEFCSGGDLYTRDPYTEEDAARIICSVLSAVEYMHSNSIIHRDLKFENIMFTTDSPDADVKIIDFGLSKKYGADSERLHDGVGTVYTMAPEVIAGDYTCQADLWSVGVLAFMLLSSQMPFYGKKRNDVILKIFKCNYRMKKKSWKTVSPFAKGFVMELLQLDPKMRPSARDALCHPWLEKVLEDRASASEEVVENVQAAMIAFAGYSTLKKLALMVVSHQATCNDIGFLQNAFNKFDSHLDGYITFTEFKDGLEEYGYTENELDEMFRGADLDHTGVLHYTEFLAATIESHGAISKERLAEAFDRLDGDDSGFISTENLREFLGHLPHTYLDQVIDEADLTRDHRISYQEFLAMWNHRNDRLEALKEVQKRRFHRSKTSITESVSESDTESILSLPNKVRNCAPELTPETEEDFIMAEIQFREKKELSIRKYEMGC